MKKVVIVFGTMGTGKSTLTELFAKNPNTRISNFADPVKTAVNAILGIPFDKLYGSQEDKLTTMAYGKSARHWMQWLGTDICKKLIDMGVWVDRFIEGVLDSKEDITVVGDGRYPEDEFINLQDKTLGKIQVIGVKIKRDGLDHDLSHISEKVIANTPDDMFNYVVNNNGSLEDLKARADEIWGCILNDN